jgi:hypothetical protein
MPAVVVRATVEEPCAVFKIAESRKGKNIPMTARASALVVMNLPALKLSRELVERVLGYQTPLRMKPLGRVP